mmetsp:Transcript_12772/g.20096  ORF Transcript_12772/g.20096 Transcript_12772/m.20096 type:complete len:403 (+) Transcript_12772:39-1247(+)
MASLTGGKNETKLKKVLISLIREKIFSITLSMEKIKNLNNLSDRTYWDLAGDQLKTEEDRCLQIAQCTQILRNEGERNDYIINVKQVGKFVVSLGEKLSPTDLDEGLRIGVDRGKFQIQIVLPNRIDSRVSSMTLEERPDITYFDIGGCREQILGIRETLEYPLIYPKRFSILGLDPPKGIMMFGPPGTGKTLVARAVANRTNAFFIRVICSELVQKYIGEGARIVRELFSLANKKIACVIFFDELDAIGGTRFDDGSGGDNEVQRTMLEIINQLDGFESRNNVKVLMATNRPDTIDPALMRPGRLDRKIEFGLPDLIGRVEILKIHSRKMRCESTLRYELLSRMCPNSTGADLRSICTEAGMFAIRRKSDFVSESDFLTAISKVLKGYAKFSATKKYQEYN